MAEAPDLVERGLDISEGLLVVIDGSKGLRGAVTKAFRTRVVVGRCQWHKRENVVSYLSKSEQSLWRKRLQRAYGRPTHKEALEALKQLHRELEERNQSAASSLEEGLEETLTLHRLGVYGVLGHSLKTTNCIESVNALIEERCAKVDHCEGLYLVPVKWKPLRPERENLGRFRASVAGVDEIVSGWPRFVSRIQGKKSVRPETAFLILAFNRLT